MRINPIPDDEKARLRALDTLPPKKLEGAPFADRMVELARQHFDVMDAFIGIIDWEKELYLACAGSDLDPAPREDTMCAYTITQDDVLVIEHVQDDPRFQDSDAIQGTDIHWYASAPVTVKGENIGTFCIIDDEQHELSDENRADLQKFADETAEQLELHSRNHDTILGHIRVVIRERFGV